MVNDGDLVGAAILIERFKFHSEFDISDLVVRLIEDKNKMDMAKKLCEGSTELQKQFIDILISLKNVKGAVKCVKDFDMDPVDFP